VHLAPVVVVGGDPLLVVRQVRVGIEVVGGLVEPGLDPRREGLGLTLSYAATATSAIGTERWLPWMKALPSSSWISSGFASSM